MQKKMIALAIAAAFAAPVAMAEGTVTMYGSMDGGFRHQTNDNTAAYNATTNPGGGGTTDSMQMGQYNTARFGFKGVDDLGDGMKATVVLETSLAPAGIGTNPAITSGATNTMSMSNPFGLLFDRQATIGVSGGFGSVDMGWNYTASFKTIKTYDPFDYKYLAIAGAKSSDYADRMGSVQYNNKFGDVAVIAEYYATNATKTSQPSSGAGRAIAVNYAAGDINAGAAYTAVESPTGADTPVTHVTIGAGYKFGDAKVSVGYAKKSTKTTASDDTDTNMWLGGSFNMSTKMAVTAAYYSNAKNTGAAGANDSTKKTMMVGLTYSLSKATQLYIEADRATANTGATGAADTVTTGTSFGLNTSF